MEESEKQTQATSVKTKYWFDGKRRSKKRNDRSIKAQQIGRNNKGRKSLNEWNVFTSDVTVAVDTAGSTEIKAQADGYRFMSPDHFGKNMKCTSCNTYL